MLYILGLLLALFVLLNGCNVWGCALYVAVLLPAHPAATPVSQVQMPIDVTPHSLATAASCPLSSPTVVPSPTASYLSMSEQAAALLPWAREDVESGAVELEDLTQYDIELSLDAAALRVWGHERVLYVNTENVPLDEIVFRLFPQTPGYGGQMTVAEVLMDGQPAASRLELQGSALYVALPRSLFTQEAITVDLTFEVTLPASAEVGYGQLGYIDRILALPQVYPLIPVYDDEGWNVELAPTYGDAVYSDVALYRVQVTAPSEQVIVASGSCTSEVEHDDVTTVTTFVTGPMRDFMVVASTDFVTSTATVGGTLVTSYYLPLDAQGGERALTYASEALRVFSEDFGQYPYTEFDVVETPTTAGGIEYPGLIVVAKQLYGQDEGFFEFATVHETAHQWWYGLVGNDQVDDPWVDEALAQYSTLLYYERVKGPATADAIRDHYFERPYDGLVKEGDDVPVGQPVRAFGEADYGPVVYAKGPLFLQALRDEVGTDVFLRVLREYLKIYQYGIATPEGFLAIAEEASGQELDDLYGEWILGVGSRHAR